LQYLLDSKTGDYCKSRCNEALFVEIIDNAFRQQDKFRYLLLKLGLSQIFEIFGPHGGPVLANNRLV
jgi:hypothetical protein